MVIEHDENRSPLARLVLVMVCLGIFGGLLAGVLSYTVDLPGQRTVSIPANNEDMKEICRDCLASVCKNSPFPLTCAAKCETECSE
jgi:hypothetical protein